MVAGVLMAVIEATAEYPWHSFSPDFRNTGWHARFRGWGKNNLDTLQFKKYTNPLLWSFINSILSSSSSPRCLKFLKKWKKAAVFFKTTSVKIKPHTQKKKTKNKYSQHKKTKQKKSRQVVNHKKLRAGWNFIIFITHLVLHGAWRLWISSVNKSSPALHVSFAKTPVSLTRL